MSNHPNEPAPQSEPSSSPDPASPPPPNPASPLNPTSPPPLLAAPLAQIPPTRRQVSGAVIVSAVIGAVFFTAAGFAVGFAVGGSQAGASSSQASLTEAHEACAPDSSSVRLGDDGDTLMIDRAWAEENPGAYEYEVLCIFEKLEVPDFMVSQIESTRALDGTQEADFGNYSAFWTYHPDDGLNMTITLDS